MKTAFLSFLFLMASISYSQIEPDSIEQIPQVQAPTNKHILNLSGALSYPVLYEMGITAHSHISKFRLNSGARISYIYSNSKQFGFGLEYDIDMLKLDIWDGGLFTFSSLITNDELNIRHEGFNIIGHNFMPIIEWRKWNSKRPMGLVHQFGMGITFSKVLEKNYEYELKYVEYDGNNLLFSSSYPNDAEENFKIEQLYNYENKGYWGGALMYNIMYRGRLTKSLLWSIGLRTQVNLAPTVFVDGNSQNEIDPSPQGDVETASQYDMEDTMYWINRREMRRAVAMGRLKSVWNLQFGISYRLDQ